MTGSCEKIDDQPLRQIARRKKLLQDALAGDGKAGFVSGHDFQSCRKSPTTRALAPEVCFLSQFEVFPQPARSDREDVGIHSGSKPKPRKLRQINFFTSSRPEMTRKRNAGPKARVIQCCGPSEHQASSCIPQSSAPLPPPTRHPGYVRLPKTKKKSPHPVVVLTATPL